MRRALSGGRITRSGWLSGVWWLVKSHLNVPCADDMADQASRGHRDAYNLVRDHSHRQKLRAAPPMVSAAPVSGEGATAGPW